MKLTHNIYLFCTSLILLVACGNSQNFLGRSPITDGNSAIVRGGDPVIFKHDDPDCDVSNAVSNLGTMQVWLQTDTGPILYPYDFSDYSGSGLKNKTIKNTITGFDITKEDTTQTLFFCRKNSTYTKKSLENTALASLVGVHQAFQTFKNVYPKKKLPSIFLNVHPKIGSHYKHYNRLKNDYIEVTDIHTNNAMWAAFDQTFGDLEGPNIVVIPPERDTFEHNTVELFWEWPGVFAHEAGHHIFWTLAKNTSELNGDYQKRDSNLFAIRGIDEGFADIVSFYSFINQDQKIGTLNLISKYGRNVESNHYDDSSTHLKSLTERFQNIYFSDLPDIRRTTYAPSYKHFHTLGAILAHSLLKIVKQADFKAKFKDKTNPQLSELKIFFEWAQELERKRYYYKYSEGVVFLDKSIHLFLKTVAKHQISNRINHRQLNVIEKYLPAFYNRYFGEYK